MSEFRYTNPITRDPALSMRDHCILKVGERWFCTGTSQPAWNGPNPGVRLLESDDLLHWRDAGWLIDASELAVDCPFNGRFWAPEIHRAHGRFYLTVNSGHEGPQHPGRRMDDHRVWIFAADAITGPYTILTPNGLGSGFKNDASLFTDDDGRSYLYCSGGGLWQAEIDLLTGIFRGEHADFQQICGPRDVGNPDWMIGGIEGPFVIKRHGAYWMFFSAWTRGYEIGVMRAEHPLGPWKLTPEQPVFGTRKRSYRAKQALEGGYGHLVFDDTPDPYLEVGHNAIFEGPDGRDWLCCHYIPDDGAAFGESTALPQLGMEPMDFRASEWSIHGPTWSEQVVPLTVIKS
ncbi:MAG: family 43 glycosylhydrolase [Luteolibacter sp.]